MSVKFDLGGYAPRVNARFQAWQAGGFTSRLWAKDPTLWSSTPVPELADRLGWLDLPRVSQGVVGRWQGLRDEVTSDGIGQVVLLGMGGSSLAAEVFQSTFGNTLGNPELVVVDTTHPEAVAAAESRLDLRRTLFIVSSKSGTTIETMSLFRYFYARTSEATSRPGRSFVAITDPGTSLGKMAKEREFRSTFAAPADVGGRYSALGVFGLLPATLIGADTDKLLEQAVDLAEASKAGRDESCLMLGAALGELALAGRDKVGFATSPTLSSFPNWLEQLIAESSGKDGRGIIPIVGEPAGESSRSDDDRLAVDLRLQGDGLLEAKAGENTPDIAGLPAVRFTLTEKAELAREMLRWEIAVAAACAALGVHPFNQPDVELSKQLARRTMSEPSGAGPGANGGAAPGARSRDPGRISTRDPAPLREALQQLLERAGPRDYVCIQAYLAPRSDVAQGLNLLRSLLGDRTGLATTAGWGPRFLHSTGQLHKGGPDSGIFLQLVDRPANDLEIPEAAYSFGNLIAAQAAGDYQALVRRGRRVLAVDLGADAAHGLAALAEAL